jgi:Flp pilus assembly protein TadD
MLAMRRLLTIALLAVSLGASVGCATPPTDRTDIDVLLHRLGTTQDVAEAKTLEGAIRHAWAESGRNGVDRLMELAAVQVLQRQYRQALATLDRVVATAPDYAEGWNMRATVHYLRDEYPEALVDIKNVLTLEPRHFEALTGLGRIMLALDDKPNALTAFRAALAVNPHLTEIRDEVNSLEDELAGMPI